MPAPTGGSVRDPRGCSDAACPDMLSRHVPSGPWLGRTTGWVEREHQLPRNRTRMVRPVQTAPGRGQASPTWTGALVSLTAVAQHYGVPTNHLDSLERILEPRASSPRTLAIRLSLSRRSLAASSSSEVARSRRDLQKRTSTERPRSLRTPAGGPRTSMVGPGARTRTDGLKEPEEPEE